MQDAGRGHDFNRWVISKVEASVARVMARSIGQTRIALSRRGTSSSLKFNREVYLTDKIFRSVRRYVVQVSYRCIPTTY